jgi:signal transduction histidine kinase
VVGEFKLAADEKHIRLEFEGAPQTGCVQGDEAWLQRALANLLSNALKYTLAGGRVQVRYSEADGQGRVEVSDTGPGIPTAAQARLFERFYRVRTEATKNAPGTGLGLAIVKTIVEKHQGRVWVSSEEGRGSTFGLALPLVAE